MSNIIIKVKDLKKDYTNDEVTTHVLCGVSFEIDKGEFLAIMGPSGSGKSTLMHILGFLDRATSGTYIFENEDVVDFDELKLAELRNKKVGFVFQSFFLLTKTTVLENVKLPLIYSGKNASEDKAKEALKAVGLEQRMKHYSNQLSGGEKQRVAMARALVNDPDIIFADEPTGNLDSKSGAQVMNILEKLNEQGKTIILVTHEQETAKHARRIIQLKDGKIVRDYKVSSRINSHNGVLNK